MSEGAVDDGFVEPGGGRVIRSGDCGYSIDGQPLRRRGDPRNCSHLWPHSDNREVVDEILGRAAGAMGTEGGAISA